MILLIPLAKVTEVMLKSNKVDVKFVPVAQ